MSQRLYAIALGYEDLGDHGDLRCDADLSMLVGKPARRFRDFTYRTRKSWSRSRRVVGKAEHMSRGDNPRFAVTSIERRMQQQTRRPRQGQAARQAAEAVCQTGS